MSFFGLAGSYELIDLDPDQYTEKELAQHIRARLCDYSGFNVTIPHKQLVYSIADERSPEADLLSAVNTVRIDSCGRMLGFNTDLPGFMSALEQNCPGAKSLESVLVLGAGGAARAVIAGLFLAGAKSIVVAVRNPSAAEDGCRQIAMKVSAFKNSECRVFVRAFPDHPSISCESPASSKWGDDEGAMPPFSLIVNCTPLGLNSDDQEPPWSKYLFASSPKTDDAFFFDTVYRKDRSPTLLMRMASTLGFKTCDGLSMLIEQARFAFEIWTGRRINAKYMFDALK